MKNVPRTANKKLITTDQTSPVENIFSSITAEALKIEDNILFNDNL